MITVVMVLMMLEKLLSFSCVLFSFTLLLFTTTFYYGGMAPCVLGWRVCWRIGIPAFYSFQLPFPFTFPFP